MCLFLVLVLGAEVHHIMGTCGGDIAAKQVFPIVDTCLSCEDIARQSCAMVRRWRFLATFLRPVFSAPAHSTLQTCMCGGLPYYIGWPQTNSLELIK